MSRKTSFLKPCKKPGCPGLTFTRYCEKHSHLENQEKKGLKRSGLYSTRQWKRLRLYVLKKQPLCESCQKIGVITEAKEIDHIKPHSGNPELFFNPGNLQSLCKSCHSKKTRKEQNGQ